MVDCPECGKPLKKNKGSSKYYCENSALVCSLSRAGFGLVGYPHYRLFVGMTNKYDRARALRFELTFKFNAKTCLNSSSNAKNFKSFLSTFLGKNARKLLILKVGIDYNV